MEHPYRKETSESLERCINTTLSSLYPSCQSTSSTLRRQVLRVAERCYCGDALRCLFHFLLPAKQLLAELQRDARALHQGWAFSGDCWPLCVHEKVAVHLYHPDQHHLRPGDFYLLVSPPAAAGPRLLLCSVSLGGRAGRHVEQQEVAAAAVAAPGSLFTMSWLDSVNRERERRGASRLESCLLSLHSDVFRVPWEDLVYPQVAGRPGPTSPTRTEVKEPSARVTFGQGSASSVTRTDQSQAGSEGEDSEGEYVELAELPSPLPRFSPQQGSLTQSISLQRRARTSTQRGFSSSFGPAPKVVPVPPHSTLTPSQCVPPRLDGTLEQQSEGGDACGHPGHGEQVHAGEGEPESRGQEVTEMPTEEERKGHASEVKGEVEDECEGMGNDSAQRKDTAEEPDQEDGGGKGTDEEVEIEEEEVCVTVLQQCLEERTEEQTQREGAQEKGRETPPADEKGPECSYFENNATQALSGDSCFEKSSEKGHVNEFYSQKKIPRTDDSGTQLLHSTDSTFESSAPQTHTTVFNSEMIAEQTRTEGSYCESILEANTGDSGEEKTHLHSEVSHFELEKNRGEMNTSHAPHCDEHTATEKAQGLDCESCTSSEPENSAVCERAPPEATTAALPLPPPATTGAPPPPPAATTAAAAPPPPPATTAAPPPRVAATTAPPPTPLPPPPPPLPLPLLGEEAEEKKEEGTLADGGQQLPVSVSVASPQLLRSTQSNQSAFYSALLKSGAMCLPGSKDKAGRAILIVSSSSSVWSSPDCNRADVLRLLRYYGSTLRQEVRALGLVVLVDARRAAPPPAHLFPALRCLQEDTAGSVHSVLLLVDGDTPPHNDTPAAIQVEQFHSLRSLQRNLDLKQLPVEFGGSLNFSQSNWLAYRLRVDQLKAQCVNVINLLQKAISIVQTTPLPSAAQDAERLLSRTRTVMCCILEDSRLVQLQQEGGASLSRLRTTSTSEEERAAVASVSELYEQVDELLHHLVTLSNRRTEELRFVVDFAGVERGLGEVSSWLQDVGEPRMELFSQPEDALELLRQKQKDFKDFCTAAHERCHRGEELLRSLERWASLSSAHLQDYEVKVHAFWARLQDFSQRVRTTGHSLDRAVRLYAFLDQAYGWALEGMRHLAAIAMEDCTKPEKCQAAIGRLDAYGRQHPPIPDALFQEMKVAAGELRGERGLRQWDFAWSKCQETSRVFDRKMEAALRTRDSAHRRRSESAVSRSSASIKKTLSGLWGSGGSEPPSPAPSSSCPPEDTEGSTISCSSSASSSSSSLLLSASSPATPQQTPLLHRLLRSASVEDAAVSITANRPGSTSRRPPMRKIQSFDVPSTPEMRRCGPRSLAEPPRRGNTGVFIRGLEVSSTEATERPPWTGPAPCRTSTPEPAPRGSKLRHVVEEMVTTEREYVRSLHYVVRHYFPEMERRDLPQDLRGKRSVIFGNLEKLLDFHSQFFLKELEACWRHPLRVPHCFIRHQEQFGLYALYSKNKPKSDALLASHGTAFFRRKQVELGDKMDLSSYLLKPVQRMSKYALLLADLIKEVGAAQEAELAALLTATDMVKFQLRHGNDLLAMDAVRDCDVNLKEQGQLIRQDEFTVWTGRRKCERHVFLFEELVLFSKPKKMEGGLDVFIYKHSFKTADVGLTESSGDSGRCFEIWFRRRTSRKHTFVLQATTEQAKNAWTTDIARILWTQATRNKELRLREMVSMGVGNKPFLDIQPSDAAISDRAVHCIMKSRGARTRASIAVSTFDHSNPFKRGAVTSDPASPALVSSGLLGPLNLHMYSHALTASSAESSFITSGIEEDEQEHETASQPSMTTESSGSSSRCLSGSTGSDSGCVSAHLQEPPPDETGRHARLLPSVKQLNSSQYISAGAPAVLSPATVV